MASLSGRPVHIVQAVLTGDRAHLRNAAQRAAERKREKKRLEEEKVKQRERVLQQALLAWVKDKGNYEAECRSRDAAAHLDTHPIND